MLLVEHACIPHDVIPIFAPPLMVIPGLAVGLSCKAQVHLAVGFVTGSQAPGVAGAPAVATACAPTLNAPEHPPGRRGHTALMRGSFRDC